MRAKTCIAATLLLLTLAPPPAAAADQTIIVPSDGSHVDVTLAAGDYTLTATGTYVCNTEQPGTCTADAQFAWTINGSCDDQPDDNLGLLVDNQNPWPHVCQPFTHRYTAPWSCASACAISFYILDDWYPDNSGSLTVTIHRLNSRPTACFAHSEFELTVRVDGSCSGDSDGTVTAWAWSWGDGADAGSGRTAEHTYLLPGTYTVTLTVTDNQGATGTVSEAVTVGFTACPPPEPDFTVCLAQGPEVLTLAVSSVDAESGPARHVAGYVDAYRFALPGGGSTTLPCVTLVAEETSVDACAALGGTFVSRTAALVDERPNQPQLGAPLATVSVCQATLTATVRGFGVESLPAYTTC